MNKITFKVTPFNSVYFTSFKMTAQLNQHLKQTMEAVMQEIAAFVIMCYTPGVAVSKV